MHTFHLKLGGHPRHTEILLDGELLEHITRVEVVADRRETLVTVQRLAFGTEDTVELAGHLLDETDWAALQDLLGFAEGQALSPDRVSQAFLRLRAASPATEVRITTEVVA